MKAVYHVLPLALSVGLLGCNQPTNTAASTTDVKTTSVSSAPQNQFVSKLPASAMTLKVATTGTMPPFSFQDEYGNLQGIDIDVMRAIGEEQGFKVNFYKEPWQNLFDSVESGERAIAISGISYSDERAKKYGLSNSYFFNPSAIMYIEPKLNISGLADLQAKKVAGMEGSKQVKQVKQVSGTQVATTKTTFLLFEGLVQGKYDAIVQDQPLLQDTANSYPDLKVVIVPYETKDNPAAQQIILTAKANNELLADINEGIAKLKDSGEIKQIENKWLVSDAQ